MPSENIETFSDNPTEQSLTGKIRVLPVKTLIIGLAISTFFTYYYYATGSFRPTDGAFDLVYRTDQNSQLHHLHHHRKQGDNRDNKTLSPFQESTSDDSKVKEGFIVWSPSCKIPNISAHHQSISKFVYRKKRIKCSTKPSLTEVTFDSLTGTYSIQILTKHISTYLYSKRQIYKPKCCYSIITRKEYTDKIKGSIDDELETSNSTCFEKSVVLPKSAEFVYVTCHSIRKSTGYRVAKSEFYEDMFALLVIKDDIKNKLINRTLVSQYYNFFGSSSSYSKYLLNENNNNNNNNTNRSYNATSDSNNVIYKLAFNLTSGGLNETFLRKLSSSDSFTVQQRSHNNNNNKPNSIMPSVLMIGIDSVSRLNIIRSMPKTVEFLREYDWLPLEGYTKVAENTFPNLIPILTGLSDQQLRKTCYPSQRRKIDDCPFIWNEFRRRGYVTVYVEDEPTIGTFNYNKYGFARQPTDYYLRPFMLAAERRLRVKKLDGLNFCLGSKSAADYILSYCREFVDVFRDIPYFGLFWMNSFSHNDVNDVSSMDEVIELFLRDIVDYLNDTIVIFLSDHGMRWGSIRQTFVGWIEERMPYVYVHVPDSFKRDHPIRYRNLARNKNRLTSPYDLHVTLKDILRIADGVGDEKSSNISSFSCPMCRSLFEEASADRTCSEAGIPYRWCTCESDYDPVSHNDRAVSAAANFVVQKINSILKEVNNRNSSSSNNNNNNSSNTNVLTPGNECLPLELERITSVRQKVKGKLSSGNSRNARNRNEYDEYIVILETKPNRAIYEATVRHNGPTFRLVGYVERINTYGQQGDCVSDAVLKRYCYCAKKKKKQQQQRQSPLKYAVFV